MAVPERLREEPLRLLDVPGLDAGNEKVVGEAFGESGEPLAGRTVEHVLAVQVEQVEEEGRERNAVA